MGRGQSFEGRSTTVPAAVRSVGVAAMWLGCSACSVLIDSEPQQCKIDDDCTERGGAFARTECVDGYCTAVERTELPSQPEQPTCKDDGDCDASEACIEKKCQSRWACIEKASTQTDKKAIEVSLPVATSFGDPMPGVVGKVCRSIDPSCSSPVAEVTSDETGVFHITVPGDFTGYMDVVVEPFFPMLYYFPTPLTSGASLPPLNLTPAELVYGLGAAVGAVPDPERGHVLLSVISCLGTAPGVHLKAPKADKNTIPYYVQDGIPSADREVTTNEGSGGFLNFPPGNAVVDLSAGSISKLGSLSLTVRAGYLTNLAFGPKGADWGPQ